MRKLAPIAAIAAIAIALTTMPAAVALPSITWVSHTGNSNNASFGCTIQNPCDTFATALGETSAGGEIHCLDDGFFGAFGMVVNITQSITIDCAGHLAMLATGNSTAIIINGAGVVVKLRNLTITGNQNTTPGVSIQNAALVIIENCLISGFNGSGSAGISATNANSLQLNITDTLLTNNSNGILILPTGSGTTGFAFERIRVENNPTQGIDVNGLSATGAITGLIRDSVVTGSGTGIAAITTPNNSSVVVSLDHTNVANNSVVGISSIDGAAVILNNSTIQTNGTGLNANNGGAIFSYGNNPINGNQPGGIGTVPILIGFH
jgi:hypothetical protein